MHKLWPTLVLWILLGVPDVHSKSTWRWRGFEVIGSASVAKKDIVSKVPIKLGDDFVENPDEWKKWCAQIRNHFQFVETFCSAVRYTTMDAYFVVEVIEKGREARGHFRTPPAACMTLANEEILKVYDQLYQRQKDLFERGGGYAGEFIGKGGFLDFEDGPMHENAAKLAELVPPYRKNILEVLRSEKDPETRAKAANLLNWTVKDLENSMFEANQLLDDPHPVVRNNISRFTLPFLEKFEDGDRRELMIDQLLRQLDRPSHGDRNKAIMNLLKMAEIYVGDQFYIKSKGTRIIHKLATESVLFNVRDPALELYRLIR